MECDIDNELVSGLSYTISEYVWLHLRDTLLCLGLIVICAQYSLQLRWYFMNKSYLSRDREFVFHLYPSTSLKVHVLLLLTNHQKMIDGGIQSCHSWAVAVLERSETIGRWPSSWCWWRWWWLDFDWLGQAGIDLNPRNRWFSLHAVDNLETWALLKSLVAMLMVWWKSSYAFCRSM